MLDLNFMGVPEVVLNGERVTFARRGSIGLLAYLVLSHRAHAREALATLLAGDSSEDQARKYLSNVLVDLRQALGSYIVATRQTVVFDATQPSRVDVTEFLTSLAASFNSTALMDLDAVAALYRGEFLAGLTLAGAPDFEIWVSAQRQELRGHYIQLLQTQVQLSVEQSAWMAGIAPARRLLAEEPWLEEVHRLLMLMLARSGQRQAAIAQYQMCRRVLSEELGVEPLPATTALYNRLRAAIAPLAHNLPTPRTPFVGRTTELYQLIALLSDPECRLVTVTGLGGSGKTRLALEVARAYATPSTLPPEQPFPDGIVVVSYADLVQPPGSSVSTAANARQAILSGLETTLGSPIASLADRAALLVLDNLEHLQPGVRALEDVLSQAPSVKILATARAPLHLAGERVLHVDGLALPDTTTDLEQADASALFLQEARRASVGFELSASDEAYLIELCRLVGGFPLALILAARWMPVIGCSALVQELEKGLDVLASSETDLPERHRSVAGILDSTLAQLTTEERELTDAMALASSGESSDLYGSSTGIPRRLLTRLRPLSERSLVSLDQAQGTLRLHPLLPPHVRGRARRDRVRAGF